MKRKWERKVEKNSRKFPSKIVFTKYQKHHILWEVFQPLFIVPKQTLMSFIYYKRSEKKKIQFWRKIQKVDAHKVIFAHPVKLWHTLPNFGTPCQILAYPAKLMILPCEMLCFRLAKCSVFLHLTIDSFANPFPSLARGFEVLKGSDSSCDWSSTCHAIACTKISLNLGLFQW